jgi:hypothetical protein
MDLALDEEPAAAFRHGGPQRRAVEHRHAAGQAKAEMDSKDLGKDGASASRFLQ